MLPERCQKIGKQKVNIFLFAFSFCFFIILEQKKDFLFDKRNYILGDLLF